MLLSKKTLILWASLIVFASVHAAEAVRMTEYLSAKGVTFQAPEIALRVSGKESTFRVPAPQAFRQALERNATASTATATFDVTYESDFPAEAQAAFNHATEILSSIFTSSQTIDIEANWEDMGSSSIIGYSQTLDFIMNFNKAPLSDVWYPSPLAEALAGKNLTGSDADFLIAFNTEFADRFYYGTDGDCPSGKLDFVTVVLHEICHGLGFTGVMYYSSGRGGYSLNNEYLPAAFESFAKNSSGVSLMNTVTYPNPSTALGTALTSNAIVFETPYAGDVSLYTPSTWSSGSSFYHVSEAYDGTDNALMTYSMDYGESIHSLGNLTLNMFSTMGWEVSGEDPVGEVMYATIGSSFTVDSGDTFDRNPKLYIKDDKRKKRAKVLSVSGSSIECEWRKKLDVGTYSLYIKSKGQSETMVTNQFYIMAPVVSECEQTSDLVFNATGEYFGSKKPKMYFEYAKSNGKIGRARLKVTQYDMNSVTAEIKEQKLTRLIEKGISEVSLIFKNKIGEASCGSFTLTTTTSN